MTTRPVNLLYASTDPIPGRLQWGMGLQHCFVMSSTLIMASLIAHAASGGADLADQLVRISMIVAGVATILQSLKTKEMGAGYLCPCLPGPSYLPASLVAAQTGGMSLVFGMLLVAAATQALLSRVLHRLRAFLPPEVTGVIVAMVGVTLVPLGISSICGLDGTDKQAHPEEVITGLSALGLMFGISVWGGARLRLYSVLIGIGAGYALAYGLKIFPEKDLSYLTSAGLFALPVPHAPWDLSFDTSLILPFVIAGVASSIKAIGVISTSQKIDDADWAVPELNSIRGGILANAVAVMGSALVGGMAPSPSASNVGLAMSTGVASRRIGFAAGLIFIALAFSPVLAAVFVIMPVPVKGAILIYVACFMIVSGWQLIMTRPMEPRSIIVVGCSIISGLSIDFLPDLYGQLPSSFHAITCSPLSFATVMAITLNMIMQIGITRRSATSFDFADGSLDDLIGFLDKNSAAWGIRPEVVHRMTDSLIELVDTVLPHRGATRLDIELSFDKVKLELQIAHDGETVAFPDDAPHLDDVAKGGDHLHVLSAHLVNAAADGVSTKQGHDLQTVKLHFLH